MPGLSFFRVTLGQAARAAAYCVVFAILACRTESALGEGQPYLIKDINPTPGVSAGAFQLTAVGKRVFFIADDGATGQELWVTDGTTQGTYLVKDIHPGSPTLRSPAAFTPFGESLLFSADDGIHGRELWISDGTTQGTYLVKDINSGGDSDPAAGTDLGSPMTPWNGRVVFAADDAVHGRELWITDGTPAGTSMIKDILAGGPPQESYPSALTAVDGFFLFGAYGNGAGDELWRSDGTEQTTLLVKDIYPGGSSGPLRLTNVQGTVFFTARDAPFNIELWKSDGTTGGTVKVKEIHPTDGSEPTNLTAVDGTLYFSAYDANNDKELWKSDGTEAGTVRVADINVQGSSLPEIYDHDSVRGSWNGRLFFSADDGVHGRELWATDGTSEGTYLVRDINAAGDSKPDQMIAINGVIYFRANDGIAGAELWKTDGTEAGTVLLADIYPGPESSWPGTDMITNNGLLFFGADDGVHGWELWAIAVGEPAIPAISPSGLAIMLLALLGIGAAIVRVRRRGLTQHIWR